MPTFVGKHFSRGLSKLSVKSKQHYAEFKYRSYSKFDFYTNANGWMRKPIFNKIVKKFDLELRKRNRTAFY